MESAAAPPARANAKRATCPPSSAPALPSLRRRNLTGRRAQRVDTAAPIRRAVRRTATGSNANSVHTRTRTPRAEARAARAGRSPARASAAAVERVCPPHREDVSLMCAGQVHASPAAPRTETPIALQAPTATRRPTARIA
jgi:hypothetical protein